MNNGRIWWYWYKEGEVFGAAAVYMGFLRGARQTEGALFASCTFLALYTSPFSGGSGIEGWWEIVPISVLDARRTFQNFNLSPLFHLLAQLRWESAALMPGNAP